MICHLPANIRSKQRSIFQAALSATKLDMAPDPLPPLPALRFFEATAHHGSVTRAAAELHVTPGAVTLQIRKLETFLGCSLFERQARGMALTAEGSAYVAACQEALALIRQASSRLRKGQQVRILLSCTPGFAVQWLVPRLQSFQDEAPTVDVQISTTNRKVDLWHEDVHFAVRHGLGETPQGAYSVPLLTEELVPVCSPRLIAPRRRAVLTDITSSRLLHDEHREDWRLWCLSANVQDIDTQRGMVFAGSNGVVEAALAGRGVALVRRSLIEPELVARRLVEVQVPALRPPLGYHLLYREATLRASPMRAFFDWLVKQARISQ